jgi:4-aminobutyrate aminotransferase-like enzyme
VPDILTFGKSIGNGFPIAAVVTTREIASCLPEYMNTVNLVKESETCHPIVLTGF